jgi:hypothetical protein
MASGTLGRAANELPERLDAAVLAVLAERAAHYYFRVRLCRERADTRVVVMPAYERMSSARVLLPASLLPPPAGVRFLAVVAFFGANASPRILGYLRMADVAAVAAEQGLQRIACGEVIGAEPWQTAPVDLLAVPPRLLQVTLEAADAAARSPRALAQSLGGDASSSASASAPASPAGSETTTEPRVLDALPKSVLLKWTKVARHSSRRLLQDVDGDSDVEAELSGGEERQVEQEAANATTDAAGEGAGSRRSTRGHSRASRESVTSFVSRLAMTAGGGGGGGRDSLDSTNEAMPQPPPTETPSPKRSSLELRAQRIGREIARKHPDIAAHLNGEQIASLLVKMSQQGPSRGLRREWQVGDSCDAKDSQGAWYAATILDVSDRALLVHYEGFGDEFNAWVPRDRVARLHKHSVPEEVKEQRMRRLAETHLVMWAKLNSTKHTGAALKPPGARTHVRMTAGDFTAQITSARLRRATEGEADDPAVASASATAAASDASERGEMRAIRAKHAMLRELLSVSAEARQRLTISVTSDGPVSAANSPRSGRAFQPTPPLSPRTRAQLDGVEDLAVALRRSDARDRRSHQPLCARRAAFASDSGESSGGSSDEGDGERSEGTALPAGKRDSLEPPRELRRASSPPPRRNLRSLRVDTFESTTAEPLIVLSDQQPAPTGGDALQAALRAAVEARDHAAEQRRIADEAREAAARLQERVAQLEAQLAAARAEARAVSAERDELRRAADFSRASARGTASTCELPRQPGASAQTEAKRAGEKASLGAGGTLGDAAVPQRHFPALPVKSDRSPRSGMGGGGGGVGGGGGGASSGGPRDASDRGSLTELKRLSLRSLRD